MQAKISPNRDSSACSLTANLKTITIGERSPRRWKGKAPIFIESTKIVDEDINWRYM